MTKADREMLIRIDERTEQSRDDIEEIKNILNGNGKKGLVEDFRDVKNNQLHCLEEKAKRKMDLKWVAIFILAIAEILLIIKG